jgi:hypothetical protein
MEKKSFESSKMYQIFQKTVKQVLKKIREIVWSNAGPIEKTI